MGPQQSQAQSPGWSAARQVALPLLGVSAQRGVRGQEGQEAEVRASPGEGPQVERKPGARPGASNVFPPARAGAPGSPSKAGRSALTSSAAPIFSPGEALTLQRQRASFLEGLIRVSSSLFSLKKSFLKRGWLTRTEHLQGDLLKAFYAFKPPGIPKHGYNYCP